MSIRNIKRSTQPVEIYRSVNNQKTHIKRVYKIINGEPVIVWDIGNEIIIEGYVSGYTSFKYKLGVLTYTNQKKYEPSTVDGITWFWNEITFNYGFIGTIDWGDGTTESYNSASAYEHSYNNSDYLIKNYDSQYDGAYFKIKISVNNIDNITNPDFALYGNDKSCIKSIQFADSIKYITHSSVFESTPLYKTGATLNIPKNMSIMTCYLSGNETVIKSIVIPNTVKYLGLCEKFCGKTENLYTTGAFQNCKALKNVTIPDSVKMIGSLCFHNCQTLETVSIGNDVEVFGFDSFNGCDLLQPFELPSSTKYIMSFAFDLVGIGLPNTHDNNIFHVDNSRTSYLDFRCDAILDVYNIPDGTIYLGHQSFSTCYWFRILSIPNTIKYLGKTFYMSGYSVCEIIYRGTVEEWFNIKFVDNDSQYGYTYKDINDFFRKYPIVDGVFYYQDGGQLRRIICDDGIIINPFLSANYKDGTRLNTSNYAGKCFDSTGKAIKDKFLILDL